MPAERGGVLWILAGTGRCQSEASDHHERIRHEEHEESKGNCRCEHASPCLRIAFNRLKGRIDRGRAGTAGLEVGPTALRPRT